MRFVTARILLGYANVCGTHAKVLTTDEQYQYYFEICIIPMLTEVSFVIPLGMVVERGGGWV